MPKPVWLICLSLMVLPCVGAQTLDFPAAAAEDPAALSQAVPGLARAAIDAYREEDGRKYLDNLFRLQIAAGRYADALQSLASLREMAAGDLSPQVGAARVVYEVFATAKARQSADGSPFDAAFQRSFREILGRLDDRTAALAMRTFGVELPVIQQTLNGALEGRKGKSSIALADALALVRAYQTDQTFRSFAPLAAPLIAEDDQRRYLIDRDVRIPSADGAT